MRFSKKTLALSIIGFVLYPLCMMGLIALHRFYYNHAPLFEREPLELLWRVILYLYYLFVVHIPLFLALGYRWFVQQSVLMFAFSIAVLLNFGGISGFLLVKLSGVLALIPLGVVLASGYYVIKYCAMVLKTKPYKRLQSFSEYILAFLAFIERFIFGVLIGFAYCSACFWFQLHTFDDYDFLGIYYGVQTHKQGLKFIF